jgi:IS5 family transposase
LNPTAHARVTFVTAQLVAATDHLVDAQDAVDASEFVKADEDLREAEHRVAAARRCLDSLTRRRAS